MKNNDDIFDAWYHSFYSYNYRFSPISYKDNNPYHQRTEAIQKELEEYNIKAKVHRHTLFNVDYIVVILDKEENNGFISHAEKKIANILKIPIEWIGMVQCCDPQEYFIKEKEFMARYPSANTGKIDFEEANNEV